MVGNHLSIILEVYNKFNLDILRNLIFSKFGVKVKTLMAARTADYVDFFKIVGKSKRLPRTGWVREKVHDPESVAEHSFRVGVLAMTLSDKLGYKIDKLKLLKMAFIRGLGEVVTGDVVVERWDIIDVSKRDEKEQEEKKEIRKIFEKIGQLDEYSLLFDEMINRVTVESKVFWQIDSFEMALQAFEYEREQGKNLEEFFITVNMHIREPMLRKMLDDLMKKRSKI